MKFRKSIPPSGISKRLPDHLYPFRAFGVTRIRMRLVTIRIM
jgi:hypothetical protein